MPAIKGGSHGQESLGIVPEPIGFEARAVSPFHEMGAYEALWDEKGKTTTFKTISDKFAARPGAVPSDFVPDERATEYASVVLDRFLEADVKDFGVRVHGAAEYPVRLRDAVHPVELFYFQGWWNLLDSRCVAVVGTRHPSPDGIARARRLVRSLVDDNFTIVSGLAAGVDTVVHETAIEHGGRTIAVLGTPLSHMYPKQNSDLQRHIAKEFLVITQVPVVRYDRQNPSVNRFFFPERNVTMSALTEATIIVEAGETSGTLVQARAALRQRRQLFILDSLFRTPGLTWPRVFEKRGAVRIADYDDIRRRLSAASH